MCACVGVGGVVREFFFFFTSLDCVEENEESGSGKKEKNQHIL